MEQNFEDKKLELLTDEELMKVVGGEKITSSAMVHQMKRYCILKTPTPKCIVDPECAWINGRCWPNPNKYEYEFD